MAANDPESIVREETDRIAPELIAVFAIGFLVSFASALVVVKAFIGFVKRHTFIPFAWYRIVFGAVLLAIYWR